MKRRSGTLLKETRCERVFVFSPPSSRHLFRNAAPLNPAPRYQRIGHDETPRRRPEACSANPNVCRDLTSCLRLHAGRPEFGREGRKKKGITGRAEGKGWDAYFARTRRRRLTPGTGLGSVQMGGTRTSRNTAALSLPHTTNCWPTFEKSTKRTQCAGNVAIWKG